MGEIGVKRVKILSREIPVNANKVILIECIAITGGNAEGIFERVEELRNIEEKREKVKRIMERLRNKKEEKRKSQEKVNSQVIKNREAELKLLAKVLEDDEFPRAKIIDKKQEKAAAKAKAKAKEKDKDKEKGSWLSDMFSWI